MDVSGTSCQLYAEGCMLTGRNLLCSGILSADTLLLAKSAVELLVRTIVDRVNQFNRWQSWMILVGLVALALTQLYYLHRGLKLCSTSVLYPLVFCVYNIIAISGMKPNSTFTVSIGMGLILRGGIDGLIYYKQASRLSALSGGLIALGTIILLTGVLALSWRLSEEPPPGGLQQTTQSALTPSLDLLEQHESELEPGAIADENDESEDETTATESTSLLRRSRSGNLIGSTPRDSAGLAQPRPGPRRRAMTEVEEIWGELEDHGDAGRELLRSRSLKWPPPSANRRRSRDIDEELAAGELGAGVSETTSLLGASGKRKALGKMRSSYMFPPVSSTPTTPDTSGPSTPLEGSRRPSASGGIRRFSIRRSSRGSAAGGGEGLQEAIGGWWPMKWWGKRRSSSRERWDSRGDEGDGGGESGVM